MREIYIEVNVQLTDSFLAELVYSFKPLKIDNNKLYYNLEHDEWCVLPNYTNRIFQQLRIYPDLFTSQEEFEELFAERMKLHYPGFNVIPVLKCVGFDLGEEKVSYNPFEEKKAQPVSLLWKYIEE